MSTLHTLGAGPPKGWLGLHQCLPRVEQGPLLCDSLKALWEQSGKKVTESSSPQTGLEAWLLFQR